MTIKGVNFLRVKGVSMKQYINLSRRIIVYVMGLFIMALGVSFSVKSNLGVSPVNSIPYVLSLITDIEQGLCTTGVFISFILIQIVILRKEFKWVNLLQCICSSLFGVFVTLANMCTVGAPEASNYWSQLIYLVISMALVALGILFYVSAAILSLPGEGVMLAISQKTEVALSTAKIGFDCTVVIIATAMSLISFGYLNGVREGTVIAAIGVGMILKLLSKLWKEILMKFLYGQIPYR
jgi:uncharacterized membrane protein YczE